ncbi:DNA-binding protein EMBP-1 [Hordeum vulgare]|nr:DNA-binding protein EMBP-1 [Hordeum vulgare]
MQDAQGERGADREKRAVTEAALASARDLDSRVQPDIHALAALLRSWSETERNISSCNLDGYELRKIVLIYLLDYHANEAEDNIPYDVRQILKCLK